jgi:hypothetical protein
VIICTKATKGNGNQESPIRTIKEIYDFDGNKIADVDPHSFSIEEIREVLRNGVPATSKNMNEFYDNVDKFIIEKFIKN